MIDTGQHLQLLPCLLFDMDKCLLFDMVNDMLNSFDMVNSVFQNCTFSKLGSSRPFRQLGKPSLHRPRGKIICYHLYYLAVLKEFNWTKFCLSSSLKLNWFLRFRVCLFVLVPAEPCLTIPAKRCSGWLLLHFEWTKLQLISNKCTQQTNRHSKQPTTKNWRRWNGSVQKSHVTNIRNNQPRNRHNTPKKVT